MRTYAIAVFIISFVFVSAPVVGAEETAAETKTAPEAAEASKDKKKEAPKSGKRTEMRFDELLVQGKYHFNDEAVVTVEEDKVLDALLGTRTDFKDRIKKSAARH